MSPSVWRTVAWFAFFVAETQAVVQWHRDEVPLVQAREAFERSGKVEDAEWKGRKDGSFGCWGRNVTVAPAGSLP